MNKSDQRRNLPKQTLRRSWDVITPPRTTSKELLGGAAEIIIEHQGRDYRLRLTQNGKLILTA